MTESTSSTSTSADFNSAPAVSESDVTLVQFASVIAQQAAFSDAPPSEWAFAAHEIALSSDAIDAVSGPEGQLTLPMIAIASFLAVDAEMFDLAEDPLIALSGGEPGEPVNVEAGVAPSLWSSESVGDEVEPAVGESRGETVFVLHNTMNHGLSFDWTDTILAYA